MDEAVVQAKSDPEPTLNDLYSHIYSDPVPGMKIRGTDPFYRHVAVK